MQIEFNPDGTDNIKKKPAIVIYAISLIGKVPFIARDDEEAAYIALAVRDMGCVPFSMDIEVPINFNGWYYPKPFKQKEPSAN